ncbi:hypothetical protein J6590_063059 [Homalodisca vitripennis]|nr:hypothetical protein J6590_063059 [Homalodisca vitripennis]
MFDLHTIHPGTGQPHALDSVIVSDTVLPANPVTQELESHIKCTQEAWEIALSSTGVSGGVVRHPSGIYVYSSVYFLTSHLFVTHAVGRRGIPSFVSGMSRLRTIRSRTINRELVSQDNQSARKEFRSTNDVVIPSRFTYSEHLLDIAPFKVPV